MRVARPFDDLRKMLPDASKDLLGFRVVEALSTTNCAGSIIETERAAFVAGELSIIGIAPGERGLRHLIVRAALDENEYETGIKISDEELSRVKLKCSEFHGDWNYAIRPRKN